jgi:glycine/D-amino acid oxidase-like deaminating enzyme
MPRPHYDILIIGNGILGLGLAYALLSRDPTLSVGVLGPPARPGSASLAAGAMINAWAELGEGQFEDPALAERAGLTLSAPPLWDGLAAALSEFTPAPLRPHWGTYLTLNARSAPAERGHFDYILASLRRRDIPHALIPLDDFRWLRPVADAAVTRILSLPDGHIDARAVVEAYTLALGALGADFIAGSAASLDCAGAARAVICADGTRIEARHLVLANGSFAQKLIAAIPALANAIPPLLFGAGVAFDLTLPEAAYRGADRVIRTADRGGAFSVHLLPYGGGRYYFGASSQLALTPEFTLRPAAIAALRSALTEEFDPAFRQASISIRGPGFRPVAADGFPLLGETLLPGIWLLNGMRRDGFTASPYLTRIMADAILSGTSANLPSRFAPCRALISYKTRTAAIAEAAGDDAASRARVEALYEKRRIGDFGILPEMLSLYAADARFPAALPA